MASKDKWVRRFSVDETAKHKNGFTIYKITSVLFPISSPEAVTLVSVWKRYSDVQRLHKSMRSLHAGLHLRGTFPTLPNYSYFKRFQREVIEERARTIKALLEFVAEHRLLFTSTDFVNFLQTGYPEPETPPRGVIAAIRSSLHLPLHDAPPLEYQTDDDDVPPEQSNAMAKDEVDFISQIPIYGAADVEIRQSPNKPKVSDSFESLNSLGSIDSDLYEELSKVNIDKPRVLPDLINFDAPSTSRFEDYHTMRSEGDAESVSSQNFEPACAWAGWLQAAARGAAERDHARAFHCYKAAIELMLHAAQAEPDPQRRAFIKEQTNKYLSLAEAIYKEHLCTEEQEQNVTYRVLGVLGASVMLVLHRHLNACYAMKVVRKIPNNLTEFDEYFLQRTNETREPILPTDIPYMVTLHAYMETNNLLFLILSYAPGEKLFDYIKRYIRTAPDTPKNHPSADVRNENVPEKTDTDIPDTPVRESINNNSHDDVTELLLNSQKLLKNVDKALSGPCDDLECVGAGEAPGETSDRNENEDAVASQTPLPRRVVPAAAVRQWAAEILLAVDSLHHTGLVCGDLSPSDVLLGSGGQAVLTYMLRHPSPGVWEARAARLRGRCAAHVAPEARAGVAGVAGVGPEALTPAADWWSYGALLYALLCGKPLCYYHRSGFTSHTILHIPEGLSVEEESILTQLLTYEPSERPSVEDIKQHPYFKQVDWTAVYNAWTPPD
ncbi:hypothetical protein O3G_MSEX010856 [Manduca sexta]|uniref:Ribosomal protein S6 kinase delta-1 n=3 Tax=Manduca sexta TaxID=7130 RepID=A0A921ZI53_MANSE|nr:hypothetical protein O3G_MSEX010856 [Manduca sexta]